VTAYDDERPGGLITEKLYSPLFVQLLADENRDDYGDMDILPQSELRYYQYEIQEAILDNRLPGEDARGLMAYYYHPLDHRRSKAVDEKVRSMYVDVETHGGRLWGVATLELTKELTPGELDEVKDYLSGQYSDGFGEGFEQQEIRVDQGELYVSLWNSTDEFFIDTEREFCKRLGLVSDQDLTDRLQKTVEQNFADYQSRVLAKSKQEIFDDAARIAATSNARFFLTEYAHEFLPETIEGLLKYVDPLRALGYAWKKQVEDLSGMDGLICKISDRALVAKEDRGSEYGDAHVIPPPVFDEKPSVLGHIRQARDEAKAAPAPRRASPGKTHEPQL
jgi:hypothetical protein